VVASGIARSDRFDREIANKFLFTIPFFTGGICRSSNGDGLTKAIDFTALSTIGTSNFSRCGGTDDFSNRRTDCCAVFSSGASS